MSACGMFQSSSSKPVTIKVINSSTVPNDTAKKKDTAKKNVSNNPEESEDEDWELLSKSIILDKDKEEWEKIDINEVPTREYIDAFEYVKKTLHKGIELLQEAQRDHVLYTKKNNKESLLTLRMAILEEIINLDACKDVIVMLERRTLPCYVQDVINTMRENTKSLNIGPHKFYEELGLKFGAPLDTVQMMLKKKEEAQKNQWHKWRQIGYVFRNIFTKQEYDAFVVGTLDSLKINAERFDEINNLKMQLLETKAELDSLAHTIKKQLQKK